MNDFSCILLLKWGKTNGQAWNTSLAWAASYTGSRSTPTYDNRVPRVPKVS